MMTGSLIYRPRHFLILCLPTARSAHLRLKFLSDLREAMNLDSHTRERQASQDWKVNRALPMTWCCVGQLSPKLPTNPACRGDTVASTLRTPISRAACWAEELHRFL